MSDLLPPAGERGIRDVVTVPALPDATDLYDPLTRRTVIPRKVTLTRLRVILPEATSEVAHVTVLGPRRLKSRAAGRPITSSGWERALNAPLLGRSAEPRPEWLTRNLAQALPDDWDPQLLDLPPAEARAAELADHGSPDSVRLPWARIVDGLNDLAAQGTHLEGSIVEPYGPNRIEWLDLPEGWVHAVGAQRSDDEPSYIDDPPFDDAPPRAAWDPST